MTDAPLPTGTAPSLKPPRFRTVRTITALILREMGSTYGASPGGYVWAILQPVGFLIMLSIGFSLVIRAPSLGTSFILFYATGFLPFNLYQDVASKTGGALRYARALLAYPSVTWADAIIARFILTLLTATAVFCIVMTGILYFENTRSIVDPVPVILGILVAAFTGLGIGLVNAVAGGVFPVWNNIWKIISRPLFLASGIFYVFKDLPPLAQDILWFNPLIHATGLVREGFYPTYAPDYVSLAYAFGMPMVLMTFGLVFLRSHYQKALER